MILKTGFKYLLLFILYTFTAHAWAQHINSSQTQILINNTIQFSSLQLPAHKYSYELQLPSEETADSPPKGDIEPHSGQTINYYRNDSNKNIATLKVIDPVLGNLMIWSGEITYDPNTKQLTYKVNQQSKRYYINITLLSVDRNSIPQFKIDIYCN